MNAIQDGISKKSNSTSLEIPIINKDRIDKKTILDHLLRGVLLITQTAFFIACGAVIVTLESFTNLFKFDRPKTQKAEKIAHKIIVPILPIDNYNQLDEDGIIQKLKGLSAKQLHMLRNFERSDKNRKIVLDSIDQCLAKGDPCE